MRKERFLLIPLNLDLLAAECSEDIATEDLKRACKERQDRFEARREYMRAYMRERRKIAEVAKKERFIKSTYNKAHRENISAYNKAYYEAHREEILAKKQLKRAEAKAAKNKN